MVDDVPERKRDLRDRMPLRSRENHQSKVTTRHIRDRAEHERPIRELRERPEREHNERANHDHKTRSEREKNIRDIKERNEREIKVKSEVHDKSDVRTTNEEKDTRYLFCLSFVFWKVFITVLTTCFSF